MERDEINHIIGKNVRTRRMLLGLSRSAACERTGISPRRLRMYERGIEAMDCDELILLAALLSCGVNELCEGVV